jgi:colanic acid/amylovoran biosynthesis glycosyltransferase
MNQAFERKTNGRPTVVVFCDHLLYPSETFIRAQAEALRHFSPVYAGSRRVAGLDLPAEQVHVISGGDLNGRAREAFFKLFGHAPNLAKRLRALNPVLMHSHFGPDGLRSLPLARTLELPLIVTFHGSDTTALDLRHTNAPYGYRRYQARKRVLQRGGTLFLAVSEFIRRKLLEQGFAPEKVVVHYTGVDTNFFSPLQGERESIVLFVGRLDEGKGASFLMRAMAAIQKENPLAELVLIGDGPLRRALEIEAQRELRRFRFLGTQSPPVVREWLDRASVFSVPSVKTSSGSEEAFGMVFAEAQAMGKPVVTFRSGGIPEIVVDGETGFLVPERDWQALADSIGLLLRDERLRKRLGMAGRERMMREFDLAKRTEILESIYSRIAFAEPAKLFVPALSHQPQHGKSYEFQ